MTDVNAAGTNEARSHIRAHLHNHEVFHADPGRLDADLPAQPISAGSHLDLAEAYRRQDALVGELMDGWHVPVVGFKIGLTSLASQSFMGASEPTYGQLTARHVICGATTISLDHANGPLVEPEIVVRTLAPLSSALTINDIASAVEVTAGLEIPMSRSPGGMTRGTATFTLSDYVVDNNLAGRVVHGRSWVRATTIDVAAIDVNLTDPVGETHRGRSAMVLGNPLTAVQWLVRALDDLGRELPAGTIISSGTLLPARSALRGRYTARFTGGLGDAVVEFA